MPAELLAGAAVAAVVASMMRVMVRAEETEIVRDDGKDSMVKPASKVCCTFYVYARNESRNACTRGNV